MTSVEAAGMKKKKKR